MRLPLLLASFSLVSLGNLPAQHPKTLPEVFTGSYAGGGNLFPLARTRGFIQYFHRGDQFPATRIVLQMGWRLTKTTTTIAALSHKLEIKIGNSKVKYNTLNKTFSKNFTSTPTTFFKLKTFNFPAIAKVPQDPDKPNAWIKGDAPFIWLGPNLVIQVDIQTAKTFGSTTVRATVDSMSSANPRTYNTDKSCGGTITASYIGGNFGGTVSGTLANSPVIYLVGNHLLPVDVGFLFGKGCSVTVNPILTFLGTANASGVSSFSVPFVPATTSTLHIQALHRPKSGPGLASTNASHILFGGNNNISTYLYNWTRDGLIAQYGPYSTNRGPVVLFR